jgi:hypothetical protein
MFAGDLLPFGFSGVDTSDCGDCSHIATVTRESRSSLLSSSCSKTTVAWPGRPIPALYVRPRLVAATWVIGRNFTEASTS